MWLNCGWYVTLGKKKKKSNSNKQTELAASISVDAALWKSSHEEELTMSTRTPIWKRNHTHMHMNKENRTNSVSSFVITVETEVVPSLTPRELPWGEGLGRRNIVAEGVPDLCLRLSLSATISLSRPLSPPPFFFCLGDEQTRAERQCVICSAARTATGASWMNIVWVKMSLSWIVSLKSDRLRSLIQEYCRAQLLHLLSHPVFSGSFCCGFKTYYSQSIHHVFPRETQNSLHNFSLIFNCKTADSYCTNECISSNFVAVLSNNFL